MVVDGGRGRQPHRPHDLADEGLDARGPLRVGAVADEVLRIVCGHRIPVGDDGVGIVRDHRSDELVVGFHPRARHVGSDDHHALPVAEDVEHLAQLVFGEDAVGAGVDDHRGCEKPLLGELLHALEDAGCLAAHLGVHLAAQHAPGAQLRNRQRVELVRAVGLQQRLVDVTPLVWKQQPAGRAVNRDCLCRWCGACVRA